MSTTILTWRGDDIKAHTDRNIRDGMNKTLLATQAYAQQPHVTPRDTSNLANSITIEEAQGWRAGIHGRVGSFGNVPYAIFVEIGTYKMAGAHYMRRSADAIFPKLQEYIEKI